MKCPQPSSSDRQARPYQQLARMSSGGGTPPTQQRGLDWDVIASGHTDRATIVACGSLNLSEVESQYDAHE